MNIAKHLNKDNLHHAYLIEGKREEVLPEIFKFLKSLGIETNSNSDFTQIALDSFKIEDARNLKSFGSEKGFSQEKNAKKIFLISANNFLLEAQHSLLKMFEEPIHNTHFFLVVPDVSSLLKTLVSRFYFVSTSSDLSLEVKDAELFIAMPLQKRIDYIKNLLIEPEEEDEDGNEIIVLDSTRAKALKFLNALESVMHSKILKNSSGLTLPGVPGGTHTFQNSSVSCFSHIFKVREFLRQPGSSAKSLMESVALIVPEK